MRWAGFGLVVVVVSFRGIGDGEGLWLFACGHAVRECFGGSEDGEGDGWGVRSEWTLMGCVGRAYLSFREHDFSIGSSCFLLKFTLVNKLHHISM